MQSRAQRRALERVHINTDITKTRTQSTVTINSYCLNRCTVSMRVIAASLKTALVAGHTPIRIAYLAAEDAWVSANIRSATAATTVTF